MAFMAFAAGQMPLFFSRSHLITSHTGISARHRAESHLL
jgi:hypothetical protein